MSSEYRNIWLCSVQIVPAKGYKFNELVELDAEEHYDGAWANVLVKSDDLHEVLDIIAQGLKQMNFVPVFIDKIENVQTLLEEDALGHKHGEDADYLLDSDNTFIISDELFPYRTENWRDN